MIQGFERASGQKINYRMCPRRSGDLASFYADPSLAIKELGWMAERDLDDMCKNRFDLQKMLFQQMISDSSRSRCLALAVEESEWIRFENDLT